MKTWKDVVVWCVGCVSLSAAFCVLVFYVSGCTEKQDAANAEARRAYYERVPVLPPSQVRITP